MKYHVLPFVCLTAISAFARGPETCAPTPPATCNEDDCCRTYCLGPDHYAVNPPLNPITCDGDWVIDVAGFYWNFHQDGMEYAIDDAITSGGFINTQLFLNADFENPHTSWDYGFKLNLGYNTTCDGWDFGVIWTRFNGSTSTHIETEADDNHILLALWSYKDRIGGLDTLPVVSDIETNWKLNLNLIDVEIGREFWNSKKVAFRLFIGSRFASIKQSYHLQHKGGDLPNVNNFVDLDNDFRGFGFRGGIDTTWNISCGWAIYADLALSAIYGRFSIDHDEENRQNTSPFTKSNVFELEKSFRAIRYITDLELGVQWSSLFCDCQYGLTVAFGWETHIFFDQNQMDRFTHEGFSAQITPTRGDLDTQGWTLSVKLEF